MMVQNDFKVFSETWWWWRQFFENEEEGHDDGQNNGLYLKKHSTDINEFIILPRQFNKKRQYNNKNKN